MFSLLSRRQLLKTGAFAVPLLLGAQEPTFTTAVKVVSLLVSVKNKKGELNPDLVQSDFQVFEDGRTETIKYFARQTFR